MFYYAPHYDQAKYYSPVNTLRICRVRIGMFYWLRYCWKCHAEAAYIA